MCLFLTKNVENLSCVSSRFCSFAFLEFLIAHLISSVVNSGIRCSCLVAEVSDSLFVRILIPLSVVASPSDLRRLTCRSFLLSQSGTVCHIPRECICNALAVLCFHVR